MVDSQPTSSPTPASTPQPVVPPVTPTPVPVTESVVTPPPSNTPPSSPSELPASPPKSGSSRIILLLVAILLVVGLAGAVYWYVNYSQTSPGAMTDISPLPTSSPEAEFVACTLEAKICPDGSSVGRTGPNCEFAQCPGNATSEVCQVAMVMPPADFAAGHEFSEQDQNREWVFTEQEYTGNQLFTNMANLNYATLDGLGSGYVPSNVTIQCGNNTASYTNESLFTAYQEWIASQSIPEAPFTIQRTGETTIGGQPAIAFTVSGGAFDSELVSYLVTTPAKVYLVSKTSMSPDTLLQDTTQQIFDSITFQQN